MALKSSKILTFFKIYGIVLRWIFVTIVHFQKVVVLDFRRFF